MRALQRRQFAFDLCKEGVRARDEARGPGPPAKITRGVGGGVLNRRIAGETQIIIRGHIDTSPPVLLNHPTRTQAGLAQAPQARGRDRPQGILNQIVKGRHATSSAKAHLTPSAPLTPSLFLCKDDLS